jgi:hypothetical protein
MRLAAVASVVMLIGVPPGLVASLYVPAAELRT